MTNNSPAAYIEDDIKCNQCQSKDIITSHITGDTTCTNCGLVLSERMIDTSPEWNCYYNDDKGDPTRNVRACQDSEIIVVGGHKKDRELFNRLSSKSKSRTQMKIEKEVGAGGDLQEVAFKLNISANTVVCSYSTLICRRNCFRGQNILISAPLLPSRH